MPRKHFFDSTKISVLENAIQGRRRNRHKNRVSSACNLIIKKLMKPIGYSSH